MKKAIAYILVLAMLCPLLTACGGKTSSRENASVEELSEITEKLYIDWYAYLIRGEELFGSMRWALSYLDPFFESHSWDSLQIAWAAMNRGKLVAERVKPPETKMTSSDYDKLVRHGKDVSSYWLAIDSIQALKDSVLDDFGFYQQCLNEPSEIIFSSTELATFEQWARLMRQICDLYLRNFAIETDYLLLALDDVESGVDLIGAIAKNCPQINAWRKDNPKNKDELIDLLSTVTDQLETLVTRDLSSIVGQQVASLDRDEELYSQLDIASSIEAAEQFVALRAAGAPDLVDFPVALPYPDWWTDDTVEFMYLWDDDGTKSDGNESKTAIMPGDMITAPPDQYLVKWPDVSKDEYLSYIVRVRKNQALAEHLVLGKQDGAYLALCETEFANFSLIWEENEVSLMSDGSVCLAPYWYTYLQRTS